MSEPNQLQVGGDHYKTSYQHWDWSEDNGLLGLEYAATKYLCRWEKKGKAVEDLQKARHYAQKLLQRHQDSERIGPGETSMALFLRFYAATGMDETTGEAVYLVASWSAAGDIVEVIRLIDVLIEGQASDDSLSEFEATT